MKFARSLCCAWVLAAAVPATAAPLATEPCRLTAPRLPGIDAACGRLPVPADRSDPGGAGIELFVARVPALSAEPRPDPLLIVAGGPGQAATDFYLSLRAAFEPIRRERDIVLVDQRGTGRSRPLECAQADAATLDTAEIGELPALMRACLDDLDADPRFFTTSPAVADLEDVRLALGAATLNVYGVSYGTRVAQHYLRKYPQTTRALILDGVVASDVALGADAAQEAQRVLDRMFSRCAADDACASHFPNPRAALGEVMDTLAARPQSLSLADPLTGEPVSVSLGVDQLRSVVRLLSYAPQTSALLPLLIDTAARGQYGPLAAQSRMLTADLQSALSLPMHNAVVCTEDAPFFPAGLPASIADTYLGSGLVDALRATCSVWPTGVADADLRAPLRSDRPVLLLSGEDDPITPPAYAERAAAELGRARLLVGPGQGHGLAAVGCVPRLMREFLEQLEPAVLDASCLERQGPSPFFLDFSGPSP
jgi:pimeloyl-ACP methyl ester carboxylesterase